MKSFFNIILTVVKLSFKVIFWIIGALLWMLHDSCPD